MEALITLDREYSVEWDDDRGQIKIESVWLVGNGKEVEVTEVMDGADMAHFHRELEERQIAAAEMMNDEQNYGSRVPFDPNQRVAVAFQKIAREERERTLAENENQRGVQI